MNIQSNVRINRTKMLDEAALNHRPTHYIHTFLIFLLVYGIVSLAREFVVSIPTAIYLMGNETFVDAVFAYLSKTIGAEEFTITVNSIAATLPWYVWLVNLLSAGLLIVGAIIYCKKFEKRSIASLGFRKTSYALEYLVGMLIGAAMYLLSTLIAYLTGSIEIVSGDGFSWMIILFFVAFVIQGAGEEVFLRGYLMTSIARDYKVALALIFSSAVFSLLHASNTGVGIVAMINIFLFGVFEGIYVLKRGDIIGACAIHSIWNFTQGNILGSSVSGMSAMPSIFRMIPNMSMKASNGGEFGLEGGYAVTIVVLVAIGILMLTPPKRSALPEYELLREEPNSNQE